MLLIHQRGGEKCKFTKFWIVGYNFPVHFTPKKLHRIAPTMNTLRQLAARIVRQCAVAAACAFDAICGMQRCCPTLPPLPPRKFEIKFALRRIGILAGFALAAFAAPDAQAQTTCLGGQGLRIDGTCGACPTGQIIQDGICTSCPAGQLIKSGVCAAPTTPEEKCTVAKWSYNFGEDACYINFKISGGSNQMACQFGNGPAFINYIPCEDVFGADYSFPLKPSGSSPVYVYNCDPDDESGLIPATINTIGATSCACPAGGSAVNGAMEDEFGDCPSDHDPTLIAEVQKRSPDLDVVRDLLDKGARPNVTTSAGTPILVVAATLLHAKVVSVLITAGADVSVKMDGIFDSDINPAPHPRFIPLGLVEHGFHSRLPVGRRMAETFIHFGDAAGGRFDWSAQEAVYNLSVGVAAFHILDGQHQIFTGNELPFVRTMARYLLDLGVECGGTNAYFDTSIPASFCARPSCRARDSGKAYSCSVCAGFPLRSVNGASCVSKCGISEEADTTTWPDSQCRCANGATEDEYGDCPSDHDPTLITEVQKGSPELAVVRDLLDKGARPNVTTSAGTPILVVAATLLHAKVVSVLITAGADVSVKMDGIFDSDINPAPHPRFIPLGLVEHGFHSRLPVDRRMAETFIHFGDAAGGRFDWSAQEAVYNLSVGVAAFHILDGQHQIFTGNELPFVRTMARYLLDLGVECGGTNAYFDTPIPASFCPRPSCRARDSGKAYSCSVCAGLPLRSANGASCVAACRGDAEADTTTWPDGQCKCPDGVTEDEFGCQSDHDSTLIAEVQERSPDLAVVRDLLDKGARPNITISAGTPLLIVAATLGHAKIVSVLVTAGADADARDSDENAVPHIVAINDFGSAPLHYSWGKALNVLRHFADAVNQSGAAYDWTSTRINGLRAVEILKHRYSAAAAVWSGETVPEKEKAMLRMANIMLANGDSCRASLPAKVVVNHITCTGSGSQLLTEVQKAPGAANLSVVLERLNDDVGPDTADANGVPVLIVAATMGHAEIVSVLVTAGANVTAKDPNVSDMLNVVHHAATPLNRPAAGPRSLRASVLYYFGGGLDVRNAASGDAVFDWNAESASGYRPLDILFNATAPDKLALAGEDENLIREMSDYIRAEGGVAAIGRIRMTTRAGFAWAPARKIAGG